MKRYETPNAEYIEFYSVEETTNDVDTWDVGSNTEPDEPIVTPEDEF